MSKQQAANLRFLPVLNHIPFGVWISFGLMDYLCDYIISVSRTPSPGLSLDLFEPSHLPSQCLARYRTLIFVDRGRVLNDDFLI